MIYPIYTYGNEILRKKTDYVDIKDPTLPILISDMFETMHNAEGAGLAASQIGISKKIIVIDEEISKGERFTGVFINADVLQLFSYGTVLEEGCLSFPGIIIPVVRALMVEIEYFDKDLIYHKEQFSGIKARILQHEFDHTEGTLFIDKISSENRLKLFMQLEDIKNKRVITKYPIA
jgi:peptide deformylase